MAALSRQQKGTVSLVAGRHKARWKDVDGKPKSRNFASEAAAHDFLRDEVRRVEAERLLRSIPGEVGSSDIKTIADEVGLAPANVRALVERDEVDVLPRTFNDLADRFLESWGPKVDPSTYRSRLSQLQHVRDTFGDRHPDSIRPYEIEAWRLTVSSGVRHYAHRMLRQVYRWGLKNKLVTEDPTFGIENPHSKRSERRQPKPFQSWAEVEEVIAELGRPEFKALVVSMVDAGLRPEEAFGLNRADVEFDHERRRGRFVMRRRFSQSVEKAGLKRRGEEERTVPFTSRTYEALKALPPRLDTLVLFPAKGGGRIDLSKWSYFHWRPAFAASGVEYRVPYDCRHTAITWALSAGIPTERVAKLHGTSEKQIRETYSGWIKVNEDDAIDALESWHARQAVAE
jgi:integrase